MLTLFAIVFTALMFSVSKDLVGGDMVSFFVLQRSLEKAQHDLESLKEQARQKQEESERRFQNLCEECRFIMLRNDRKGTVKYVNKVVEEYGMKKEDVIGRSMLSFIPIRKRLAMLMVHVRVIRGDNVEGETELITPKGVRIGEYAANPVRENGKIVGCETIIRDITEKKEIERKLHEYATQLESEVEKRTIELKASRDKLARYSGHLEELVEEKTVMLRQAERMAAIGELATIVAHDLRNPLQGIKNGLYVLKNQSPATDEKTIRIVQLIENDIRYSDKIVNELLDYSVEIHLEQSETTPRTIVEEAATAVNIPENVRLLNETQHEIKITLDTQQIRKVFTHIIRNAVEAMPQGGTLRIESESLNGNVVFKFSDTGVGIPQDIIGKISKPLFTTKAKGIGLGLAISKRIVETHGGSVLVHSTLGKGTTVTVTIPREGKSSSRATVWINDKLDQEIVAHQSLPKRVERSNEGETE